MLDIVGMRHYSGVVRDGEEVELLRRASLLRAPGLRSGRRPCPSRFREPGNPYDRNAIRVNNSRGEQVGNAPVRVPWPMMQA